MEKGGKLFILGNSDTDCFRNERDREVNVLDFENQYYQSVAFGFDSFPPLPVSNEMFHVVM